MTFEDELGSLLRQAGEAHTLPTPAGAEAVTSRYQRRHRRRTSLASVAAALVLAVASFGVFKATAPNESSTVATVPETAIAVIDEAGDDAAVAGGTAEDAVPADAESPPDPVPAPVEPISSTELLSSMGSIVTLDDRYVGFSAMPAVPNGPELTEVVGLESTDGENWTEFDLGDLPDSVLYVHALHEGDSAYLMVAGDETITTSSPGALFVSNDLSSWTKVEVPTEQPAEGMISGSAVLDVAHGPAGFVAVIDAYEDIDPARLGLSASQTCGVSGRKETPDAEQATYSIFGCDPGQAVEEVAVDVAADFQPRDHAYRPDGRVLFIGDGSNPVFVDAPAGIARVTADASGYYAMTTGSFGANSISRSVDGRTWTGAERGNDDTGPLLITSRLISIDDRLVALAFDEDGSEVVVSEDDGATWADIELPSIDGVTDAMAQTMVANEHGVAIAVVDRSALEFLEPGSITFEFESDGYTFKTADDDPTTFEVVDAAGRLVIGVPIDDVFDPTVEIDGMERDSSGGISVLDNRSEVLVRFHPNQAMQNFKSVEEDHFGTGRAVVEKDGFRLEITPVGIAMMFSLFEADELLGTWTFDEDTESQPGLEFAENEDAIFSDIVTGEQLVVISEAEGAAAMQAAFESGELAMNGAPLETTYVLASRDGVNWVIAGQFDGFGGSMTVGDGEVVAVTFSATGSQVQVFPLPQ